MAIRLRAHRTERPASAVRGLRIGIAGCGPSGLASALLRTDPDPLDEQQQRRAVHAPGQAAGAGVKRAGLGGAGQCRRDRRKRRGVRRSVSSKRKPPRSDPAAKELKKRTLTNLYNARPQWLANAHAALDAAEADAYGWGDDWRAGPNGQGLSDDDILARLFRLNQARAGAQVAR